MYELFVKGTLAIKVEKTYHLDPAFHLVGLICCTLSGVNHLTPTMPQKHFLSVPMKPNLSKVIVLEL